MRDVARMWLSCKSPKCLLHGLVVTVVGFEPRVVVLGDADRLPQVVYVNIRIYVS